MHRRHRLHNVRDQHVEGTIQSDMCSVVVAGARIFLRGQVGYTIHPTQRVLVGAGDPAAQAEQAMRNVRQLLGEVDAQMEDICRVRVWVTDRAYLAPVMNVVARHLERIHPVYSEVIVKGLARPEMLMEVDVDVVRS
jgi:enamine deaminase RidA (YjgF/YER057c/UK114 family)